MNVLYYREPKTSSGGVSNVAYYLSRALEEKVNITRFPKAMSRGYLDFLGICRKFAEKEFDIIHFNMVPVWINGSYVLLELAKKRDILTVLNIHGIIPLENELTRRPSTIRGRVGLLETIRANKVADCIVINAEHMRAKVVGWYGADNAKIVVIPNGVRLTQFSPSGDRLELEGDPALLFLGWGWRIKGYDVLVEAAAKLRSELPKMKLHVLAFSQDEAPAMMRKDTEEFVVFHGPTPHSKIPSYLRSADMCIFPSRHEGFSIAVLEAMASGIPIVASDISYHREILCEGKNGVLFESGNADSLSRAILCLWQDMNRGRKLAEAALKTVKRYDWANIAEQYLLLYRSLRNQISTRIQA